MKIVEMISADTVSNRVHEMAEEIVNSWAESDDGGDKVILAVGLLKGAFVFMADLVRALNSAGAAVKIEFMTISSYGDSTETTGKVKLLSQPPPSIKGHEVLLVDDILDSGNSLKFARKVLIAAGATHVKTCVMLDKPERREADIEADFIGLKVPNRFIVGYGLDWQGRFRDLPYVGTVEDNGA